MKPVLTKNDFVKRFKQGEFGNKSPNWETLEDFETSGYNGLVHLRSRIAGGWGKYNVPAREVKAELTEAIRKYGDNFYLAGMAPTEKTLLQGEVILDLEGKGLYLYCSTVKLPMRDALKARSKEYRGLEAKIQLSWVMNQKDLDWLDWLLEAYPEHVIEFSTYSTCWGTIPGHRTIWWEVRNY